MAEQILDEAELIAGLKRRDAAAVAAFFEEHADRTYRLALGMLGSESDAEEVTQMTFISAMEAIDRFEARGKLDTWLYRIAHNHALMLIRKRQAASPLPDDDAPIAASSSVDWRNVPEERLLSQEAQERLWVEIARLPESLRAAFTLRDVEGLSTADCAQVQGISEPACKVRLHRARLLLRERLSGYFAEWMRHPGATAEREG
ncbi:MAG TPA: RNA polymerase sigma factor [Ktedonobacterales bacterium]